MRRFGIQSGEDVRRMREEAGVSLAELADLIDVHKSHVARIETAKVQPSLKVLNAIGVALGADLSVRFYAGAGPRIHDRFQAPMVEALLGQLDRRWSVELEVPILRPARGVIDLVLTEAGGGTTVAGEVYSEIRRVEQQIRWSAEKADGLRMRRQEEDRSPHHRPVSRLLVLRSTEATRDVARTFERTLATAYPARTHDIVLALTTPSVTWPGAGIVWMTLQGSKAALMAYPPPGISLGR
jgi:transcriptional regulator with XRE-family HTH domain